MQPSSLVFVAVVAIWAAWFVPHWIRRREHLSTARSIDRFSAAMRVLDRERAVPLRVRRTESASVFASPLRARSGGLALAEGMPPGRGAPPPTAPTPADAPTRSAASRPPRPPGAPRSRRAALVRTIRGVALLVALLDVPVLAVLSGVGLMPWWSILVALGAVVGSVFALRLAAVREQTARRTAYAMRARPARPTAAGEDPTLDRPADDPPAVAAPQPAAGAYRAGDATWSPVPVPRPTYTLKDPAPRRDPAPRPPEIDLEADAAPPARPARADRRVVGG